ncbi:hypothetical protein [Ancylobacter terrae]|uniref:hypothetical protein n=1 Tax=Ancylobacter sp. sgz301288 TaxID=3342077 RepID=UPI003858D279
MKKFCLILSVLITLLFTVYVIISVPFPFVQDWWHAEDYDPHDRFSKRHRMADWLVMTSALVGLRRDEVLAKLGPPPPTDKFTDYDLVYHLGYERGLISIDSEWLVVSLSQSGVVTEAKVIRD